MMQICDENAFKSIGYVKDYYIDRKFKIFKEDNCFIKEQKKGDLPEKTIILANDAGEGKSTFLTSVARRSAEIDYNVWVMRINLIDYAIDAKIPHSLHNIKLKLETDNIVNDDDAINFATKMAILGNPDRDANISLQQTLFKYILKLPSEHRQSQELKIVLIFDGFDEISSPEYKDKTTGLLRALQRSNILKLLITTRVTEKHHLERELKAQIYLLQPLDYHETIKFLVKFWKWHIKFDGDSPRNFDGILNILKTVEATAGHKLNVDEILKKYKFGDDKIKELEKDIELEFKIYAKPLIYEWVDKISDDYKFTSNPLNLKMLGEIVFAEKFLMPQNFGPLHVFEKFINTKFEIHLTEKTKIDKNNPSGISTINTNKSDTYVKHYNLAINLLVPEKYKRELLLPGLEQSNLARENSKNDDLVRIGLLIRTETDNHYQFIHRSFAEFFLSDYLIENFQNENVQTLLFGEIFCQRIYHVVRRFFVDRFIMKKDQAPSSNAFELTASRQILFAKMLDENKSNFFLLNLTYNEILIFFWQFINAHKKNEQYKRLIGDALFDLFGIAIRRHRNDIVKQIMEFSAEFDDTFYKQNILGTHAEDIKRGKIKLTDSYGHEKEFDFPIIWAARFRNIESIEMIMTEIVRLCRNSYDGNVIIDIMLEYDYLHKVLLQLFDCHIDFRNNVIEDFLELVLDNFGNDALINIVTKKFCFSYNLLRVPSDGVEKRSNLERAASEDKFTVINELLIKYIKIAEQGKDVSEEG